MVMVHGLSSWSLLAEAFQILHVLGVRHFIRVFDVVLYLSSSKLAQELLVVGSILLIKSELILSAFAATENVAHGLLSADPTPAEHFSAFVTTAEYVPLAIIQPHLWHIRVCSVLLW